MFELLDKIRQKPYKTKRNISFLFALLFSAIIFSIWLLSVYPDYKTFTGKNDYDLKSNTPISSFDSIFSSGFSSVVDQFSNIRNLIMVNFSNIKGK